MSDKKYYTYILRCTDGSLYTGITTNVKRRMTEHFTQNEKCAKYTKTHAAQNLEAVWESDSRVLASRLEYRIKQLKKTQKEKLILHNNLELMRDNLEIDNYKRIEFKLLNMSE